MTDKLKRQDTRKCIKLTPTMHFHLTTFKAALVKNCNGMSPLVTQWSICWGTLSAVVGWTQLTDCFFLSVAIIAEAFDSIKRILEGATAIDVLLAMSYLIGLGGVITRQKWSSAVVGDTAIFGLLVTYLLGGGLVVVASDFIAVLMLYLSYCSFNAAACANYEKSATL
jgi:hypothetical protein